MQVTLPTSHTALLSNKLSMQPMSQGSSKCNMLNILIKEIASYLLASSS